MKLFLVSAFCFACSLYARTQPGDTIAIYNSVLTTFYNKPASIVITDSTINKYLLLTDLSTIIQVEQNGKSYVNYEEVDSAWIEVLKQANTSRGNFQRHRLPISSKPELHIRLVSKDSIIRSSLNPGFRNTFGVRDRVELSSILFIGSRAIVELNQYCGSLCGTGMLYFLERRNGKWRIAFFYQTWIA